jgi:4,5-dihydroxyphthalate decarboxylase
MTRHNLTFACGDYDRTRALEDGSIRPDGIDLTYLRLPVEETFFRMLRHREFDVAEMSLSTYVATLDTDPRPFVALPVFTSRMFRHGAVYVNADSGIRTPADLRGKRIGSPEFQLTAGVWVRGILAEHHGVPVDSVTYYTGGQETPGRIEKGAVETDLDIRPIPAGATLSQMLADGELDALQTPRVPSPFSKGDRRVRRLFDDVVTVERDYYAATGIFPIMHVVVLRSDVYKRHRWMAQSLYKACVAARDDAYRRVYDSSALRFMEPWLIHEQGLSKQRYEPADLFAPETAEAFVI